MPYSTRKRSLEQVSTASDNKSWFEQRREDNLKANAEFLASLQMHEAKTAIKKADKPKKAATTRGIKTDVYGPTKKEYQLRPRESLNLRSRVICDDPLLSLLRSGSKRTAKKSVTYRGVTVEQEVDDDYWTQLTEPELAWSDCFTNSSTADSSALVSRIQHKDEISKPHQPEELSSFVHEYKRMSISEHLTAKVTPKRIFSLDIHPSNHSSPLVAVGDKWGHVGLWNVMHQSSENDRVDDGVCLFKPHVRPVNCTLFSPYNPHILHSASYDGTVRRCDVTKQSFTLMYRSDGQVQHMYLSEVDSNTVTVASTDGSVAYIDNRSNQPSVYNIDAGKLKCISHHPVHRQYFITGSVQGKVHLWDYRYINRGKNVSSLACIPSAKGVLSAFFSPISGDKILTCTANDQISVYNSSDLTSITCTKSFYHNNWTGRWLSNFRACWHPAREDCFVIGCLKQPRQIELYDCGGNLLYAFNDNNEHLQSVTSLNVFHPSLPVLAGANSSGKVYVFIDNQFLSG